MINFKIKPQNTQNWLCEVWITFWIDFCVVKVIQIVLIAVKYYLKKWMTMKRENQELPTTQPLNSFFKFELNDIGSEDNN